MQMYIDIWKNFDDLCMSLSHLGKAMSFMEIQSLSVYQFYNYKRFLQRINKPQQGASEE